MTDDDARRTRREAADRLLATLQEQARSLDAVEQELRRGRQLRAGVRERIEDVGGHEADTLFGSWLDSDDLIANRLEHLIGLQRRAGDALEAHIAATEVLLFELDPDRDDPRDER